MTLHRVPGFRNYQADDRGFQEIGLSVPMAQFMRDLGENLASQAQAVGESTYGSEVTTVRVGWQNKSRVAVNVFEVDRHWRDSRDAILLRVIDAAQTSARR